MEYLPAHFENTNAASAWSGSGRLTGPAAVSVLCVRCGALGYPADKYCVCCGYEMARFCNNCGERILHPVANYCTQCGISFVESGPE